MFYVCPVLTTVKSLFPLNLKENDEIIVFYYCEITNAGHYFVEKDLDSSEFHIIVMGHAKNSTCAEVKHLMEDGSWVTGID